MLTEKPSRFWAGDISGKMKPHVLNELFVSCVLEGGTSAPSRYQVQSSRQRMESQDEVSIGISEWKPQRVPESYP